MQVRQKCVKLNHQVPVSSVELAGVQEPSIHSRPTKTIASPYLLADFDHIKQVWKKHRYYGGNNVRSLQEVLNVVLGMYTVSANVRGIMACKKES